jgi:hypothetical protein
MNAPLSRDEILLVLQNRGFSNVDKGPRVYAQSWQSGIELVNIKSHDSMPLVVHPRHEERLVALQSVAGVMAGERPYCHNSQYAEFPQRFHRGRTPVHYGIDFGFESVGALNQFLDLLLDHRSTAFDGEAQAFLDGFLDRSNPQLTSWFPHYRETLAKVREALSRNAPQDLFELIWKSQDNSVSNAGSGVMGYAIADRLRGRLVEVIADVAADGTPATFDAIIRRFEQWREQGDLAKVPALLVARAFASIHPERYHTTVDAASQDRVIPWFVEHTRFVAPQGSWATKAAALSAHLQRCGVSDELELRNMFPWYVAQHMLDAHGKPSFKSGHKPRPATGEARSSAQVRSIDYRHNVIQGRLFAMLCERYGDDMIGTEQPTGTGGRADALVRLPDGRYELYEIKPAAYAVDAVRQAMGQLLEYAYRRGGLEPTTLHVVSDAPMDEVTAAFLARLKSEFGLPIEYLQVTCIEAE